MKWMTESSIQSLWQPSASFLLESVVHNNSSTQIAIPKINERTGRQLMDALRWGFQRTGAWSVPATSTTTHRFRVSQLDQNSISTPQTRFKCKVKRPKPSVQEYFRAVRDQQITTDFHIDCLAHGKTLAKKRKTSNDVLCQICENFCQYDSACSKWLSTLNTISKYLFSQYYQCYSHHIYIIFVEFQSILSMTQMN